MNTLVKDCSIVSCFISEHLSLLVLLVVSVEASPSSRESSTISISSINQYLSIERSLSVIAHFAMHSQEGDQEDQA